MNAVNSNMLIVAYLIRQGKEGETKTAMTLLLIIIFISFIGVGLPDSALGTAWPAMYQELNLPISLAGYITSTVSAGTIISSLLSARLINRFGTGLVTAVSTLLTAAALLGFSFTGHPAFFFFFAVPLGLGAGAVDTALNSFVALHYSAKKMNLLHCFYGLGVTISPFIMSLALGDMGNWRKGYLSIAMLQLGITVITFAALPLWNKVQKGFQEEEAVAPRNASFLELAKLPAVRLSCLAFFSSCAIELTAGSWSSSFFVNTKGLHKDQAAMLAMLFYIGLSLGRFFSGLLVDRFGRRGILRISLLLLPVAICGFMLPGIVVPAIALLLIGLGIGPIYPNLVHLTPKFAAADIVQSVMGIQQSMTYVGIMLMPWLFGILAQTFSTALLPYYLLGLFALYGITFTWLMRSKEMR